MIDYEISHKFCGSCQADKPQNEFNKNKRKKDGLSTKCKECNKSYLKNHYDENRDYYYERNKKRRKELEDWLRVYKSILSCELCGEDHIATLDFHHENPEEKEGGVGYILRTYGKDKVLEEIAKCKVLCSNCHRKHHYKGSGE